MSMCNYPIMLFGVDTDDIKIKPEYWQSYGDRDIPDGIEPMYEELDDFIDQEINDDRIGCEANEYNSYIGILSGYDWQNLGEPIASEDEARRYIAKALAPFCNDTEEEIAEKCKYIEDTYCG